ncbi:hypothetical protein [Tautonia sociabilis]|uniref:Sigma-70 family RNA polymerase sigma factor n=1 Tax=Tautonia sociabilis TaxID=2080755 RepID=A0A432MHE8_9BACT|nr:hypothetical protein [Tautonia sociabilis]RUL86731.1 hypothetical protein TsocGM_15610 [Tautonia sociabilis]
MDDDAAKVARIGRLPAQGEARVADFPLDPTEREAILDRYQEAVRLYLGGAVGHAEDADALFLEFSRRLLQEGDRSAGLLRDRFGSGLALLVVAHRRDAQTVHDLQELRGLTEADEEIGRFNAIWREELLRRAWRRLEDIERQTGRPFHTTLRSRVDAPGLSSAELADRVGGQLGRELSVPTTRQLLREARAEFSRLLLDEVVATLPSRAPFTLIERELIDTGLLAFCREAIDRIRPASRRR